MEPRLDIMNNTVAAKVVKYLVSANKAAADSALPAATQELMKIRASQINGCGFCLDMHTKDAAKAGEILVRLNLFAAWQEATVHRGGAGGARANRAGHPHRRRRWCHG